MRISRSELERFFVDDASVARKETGGLIFIADARRSADFLTKLRNVSRLCQIHNGELNKPKSRRDFKTRCVMGREEPKHLLRILLGLRLGQFYELEEAYPQHKFCPSRLIHEVAD